MNFFKFFKFSKLLSACVSFGILFSGFQTSGMENPRRLNLDMLGIGIRNNSGGGNESVATKSTVASPLDGIKVKIPEHCEFCNGEASRCAVVVDVCKHTFICKNKDCLQKCFNKCLDLIGLKSLKLDIDNIHRCDAFKENMENLEKLKKVKYKFPEMDRWEIYNEDKFVDEFWLRCGHSVCFCGLCAGEFKKKLKLNEIKGGMLFCPKCKKWYRQPVMKLIPVERMIYYSGCRSFSQSCKLFNEKLSDNWKNRVIMISKCGNVDVAHMLSSVFCRLDWFSSNNGSELTRRKFQEDKFYRIDNEISLGEKILVVNCRTSINGNERSSFQRLSKSIDQGLNFLDVSKLDGYIKALIKNGEYQMIIYPVEGELHDKIKAIKFIEDNAITISKELYNICSDKAAGEVYNKMLEDNVE